MSNAKTLTRRQLSREPRQLNKIQFGEERSIPDAKGGLYVGRRKSERLTPAEMMQQVDATSAGWPPVDSGAQMEDEA